MAVWMDEDIWGLYVPMEDLDTIMAVFHGKENFSGDVPASVLCELSRFDQVEEGAFRAEFKDDKASMDQSFNLSLQNFKSLDNERMV